MPPHSKVTTVRSSIRILSANVRGFRTNVGELTHNYILKHSADIIILCETFLDELIPKTFGTVPGYSRWYRKDRNEDGGGVALCHKEDIRLQVLDDDNIPQGLEMIIFRYFDAHGECTLGLGCYRPQWQGLLLINYIQDNLDRLMTKHKAHNVVIVGDLNPPGIRLHFDNTLNLLGLNNCVSFPTHRSGSSLDPFLTNIDPLHIFCRPLGYVGSSDHIAVLTDVKFRKPRPEKSQRILWKWKDANWLGLNTHLNSIDWENVLVGTVDNQTNILTDIILDSQSIFVPSSLHEQRTGDQPWFGPRCRAAAAAKHQAWVRLKRHPTRRNKELHRAAAQEMDNVQRWAMQTWKEDVKCKLHDGSMGSKHWWKLINDKQGNQRDGRIPPIVTPKNEHVLTSGLKAEQFARFFRDKMRVDDPNRAPPK